MEVYTTNATPRPCVCGGKCALTPSIKAKHEATLKHRKWRFERLCEAMLGAMTHEEKRTILRESKRLLLGA